MNENTVVTNVPEWSGNVSAGKHQCEQSGMVVNEVFPTLKKYILMDGFPVILDMEKSQGCWIVDARTQQRYLDLFGFFGSMVVGFNHPAMNRDYVRNDFLAACRVKMASSDIYCTLYAEFIRTFARIAGLAPLQHFFFIEGGALAVENAVKAAMDWKVRKNLAAGRGMRGTGIVHFERAFHGRSGYTLSLTNTDPVKTDYFAKFVWPRVPAPALNFDLPLKAREAEAVLLEDECEVLLRSIMERESTDLAAIIIEPIQGEGGDRHFRGEWLRTLRKLCDDYEVLLIFDEVQTGGGTTGRTWCCEHFDVMPDLLAFGKKTQVCGVMAGPRLEEVPENVFQLSGRINSTWGGNLVDMVRSMHLLRIVEEQKLLEHAAKAGAIFLEELQDLAEGQSPITGVRGRGLMLAFDLPDKSFRDRFHDGLFELGLLSLRSGKRSIRFRPALDVPIEAIGHAVAILKAQCQRMPPSS